MSNPLNSATASQTWIHLLGAAPHRWLFGIGAVHVLAAMSLWALWLIAPGALPSSSVPPGWMHAWMLQYQVLPSFIFGFLVTVFPRWMGLPEARRSDYLPIGLGLLGGQLLCLVALVTGARALVWVGTLLHLAGWLTGLWVLGRGLYRAPRLTWHAWSCYGALLLGLLGALAWLLWLATGNPRWAFLMLKTGSFGLLLPVYATVAHRMFPFFASNIVPGYRVWRPMALLAVQWPLWLGHLALELMHGHAWLWCVDLPLLGLAMLSLWRWWPRGPMPALLRVLFVGYAWLPVALALYALQSLWLALSGEYLLGRAPVHALSIGLFGSLLVAMVTRVTQGHSGRPLVLGGVALFAFLGVQSVALIRVAGELLPSAWTLTAWQWAAVGWLLAFTPWVLRSARIVLTARVDGRPG